MKLQPQFSWGGHREILGACRSAGLAKAVLSGFTEKPGRAWHRESHDINFWLLHMNTYRGGQSYVSIYRTHEHTSSHTHTHEGLDKSLWKNSVVEQEPNNRINPYPHRSIIFINYFYIQNIMFLHIKTKKQMALSHILEKKLKFNPCGNLALKILLAGFLVLTNRRENTTP